MSSLAIRTEAAEKCVVCGVQGELALHGCSDYLCGLPGTWNFFECGQCHSLWLNPCPVHDDVALLYPANYGFTRTDDSPDFPSGLNGAAKLAILERFYGYESLEKKADSTPGVMLGRIAGFFLRRKAGHAVRFLQQRRQGKLLDVGCGNGNFMIWMKSLGWDVEGNEIDPIAASIAIGRGLRVMVDDIMKVDLKPETFDAITLSHVAEHFSDPKKVFEKLAPSLKRGGVLVSISPNPRGILRRWFGNKWYALDPPRHLFIPSGSAYRHMFEGIGFEVTTWTSMRLFHWLFQESLGIAGSGAVGKIKNSFQLKLLTTMLAASFSCWPGLGEEVICYARRP